MQQDLIPFELPTSSDPADDGVARMVQVKRYTGGMLTDRERKCVLAMLEKGFGTGEVADALSMDVRTVIAVGADYPHLVSKGKRETARLAGNVGRTALELVSRWLAAHGEAFVREAKLEDIQRLMVSAGIALDKQQVLDGEPSSIVRVESPPMEDFAAKLANLVLVEGEFSEIPLAVKGSGDS